MIEICITDHVKLKEAYSLRSRKTFGGHLGGSVVEHLPLAQGMILESQDQVPHWAPCMEPASLPMSLPLCVCV